MRISDWSSDVCSSDLSEKVELIDSSGQLSVTLDSSGGKIVVRAGGGDVEIVADGKLTMTAPEIEMNAQNGITMNGGTGVTVSAAQIELNRSEEHTSELQSLKRISYHVFCLKKKTKT